MINLQSKISISNSINGPEEDELIGLNIGVGMKQAVRFNGFAATENARMEAILFDLDCVATHSNQFG